MMRRQLSFLVCLAAACIIAAYSPPPEVVYMHEKIPRPDAMHGMALTTNTFGPDLLGADRSYYSGILSVTGAYFAIGILGFIIFALVYTSSCCCRHKYRRAVHGGCCSKFCGFLFAPRLWYFVGSLALLAGTSAALALVSQFRSSVNDTVSALDVFNAIIAGASATVSASLSPALLGVSASVAALEAGAAAHPGTTSPAVQAAIDAMQASAAGATSSVGSFSAQLASLSNAITGQLYSGAFNVQNLGNNVHTGGITALAVFLGFIALSLLGMFGAKWSATFFRVFDACGLVLAVLLVFVFGGLFMVISLVGSDVCVAPAHAVSSIANLTSAGGLAAQSITFYTTCGPSTPPAGAYALAVSGAGNASSALVQLAALNSSIYGDPTYAWAYPAMDWTAANLSAANVSAGVLAASVSCAPLNGVYASILAALCSTGMVTVIKTWGLATAACILIFALVSAGARLCWSHPGDPLDPQDEITTDPNSKYYNGANVVPVVAYVGEGPQLAGHQRLQTNETYQQGGAPSAYNYP